MSNPQADRAPAAVTSSLAVFAAIACLACTLLLIAATIVLALIPVYLSNRNVTPNSGALRSSNIETYVGVTGNPTSSGRKRSIDNSTYINATLDSSGYAVLRSLFIKHLPSSIVSDCTIVSATLVSNPFSSNSYPYAFRVLMYLTYKSGCLYHCQIKNAGSLKSKLEGIRETGTYGTIPFYKNGQSIGSFIILGFIVGYVSNIIPYVLGSSPAYYGTTAATSSTSNTTASIVSNGTNSTSG